MNRVSSEPIRRLKVSSENIEFAMATRVAAVGKVMGIEEMEKRLVELVEKVEREKENTRDIFQQLHSLLFVREQGLLRELDGVVVEAKLELKEKRESINELQSAKESTERELTKNKLKAVLEKNMENLGKSCPSL